MTYHHLSHFVIYYDHMYINNHTTLYTTIYHMYIQVTVYHYFGDTQ